MRTQILVSVLVALGALVAGGCKGAERKAKPKLVLELEYSVNYPGCRTERLQAFGARIRRALIKRLVGRYSAGAREAISQAVEAQVVRWQLSIRLGGDYAKDLDDVKQVATQLGLTGTADPSIVLRSAHAAHGQVRFKLGSKVDAEIMRSGTAAVAASFGKRLLALDVRGAQVQASYRVVSVKLPKLSPAKLNKLKRVLSRHARLAFKIVDDESTRMEKIAGLVRTLNNPSRGAVVPDAVRLFMKPKSNPLIYGRVWEGLAKVCVGQHKRTRQGHRFKEHYLQVPVSLLYILRQFFDEIQSNFALRDYRLPGDRQVAYGPETGVGSPGGAASKSAPKRMMRSYILHRGAGITGEHIAVAWPDTDSAGHPIVSVRLTSNAGKRFRQFTRKHIKRLLAIVLNGRVLSAPVIQSEIGARVQISLGGLLSRKNLLREARDLATVLNAGDVGCATPSLRRERPLDK